LFFAECRASVAAKSVFGFQVSAQPLAATQIKELMEAASLIE
jgi:hypothetical protein